MTYNRDKHKKDYFPQVMNSGDCVDTLFMYYISSNIPNDLIRDKRLSGKEVKVLLAYFYILSGAPSFSDIKISMISEVTGYSDEEVIKIRKKLEKLGWLDRDLNTIRYSFNREDDVIG